MSRLPLSPAVAGLALGALVALLLAFALARATASDGPAAPPDVRPLRTGGAALSLPRLSQATPLPGLARTAPAARTVRAPVVTTVPAPVEPSPVTAKPKPAKPKPAKPVVIVGSG
jgi:hypothetical protein